MHAARTYIHNRFTALWILSGTTRVSWYQKKRLPTHTYHGHPLSASSIYYDLWHPLCSIYVPDSLFPQSLSKFPFDYLLAWHPPLHTFLHPIIVFFLQHMPIPSQPELLLTPLPQSRHHTVILQPSALPSAIPH